jgi:hypothetical protein
VWDKGARQKALLNPMEINQQEKGLGRFEVQGFWGAEQQISIYADERSS